jgi:hypothetical protein
LWKCVWGCGSSATYCQPSATVDFTHADPSNELYTHLALQALFRVLLAACPFCFLQYAVLPACYNCSLFLLFRVHIGRCTSPTLQWTVLCFSCFYKPSHLQANWEGWRCHSCLLLLDCLFTDHVKVCHSLTLQRSGLCFSHFHKPFSL